jgi:hypothetical protein
LQALRERHRSGSACWRGNRSIAPVNVSNRHFETQSKGVVLNFLAERFSIVGFEFQYWMPIFAALVAVAIAISAWLHPTD